MSDPFITLWTAQERDARGLSHDELARRSRLLQRRVLRRDLIEYAAGLLVIFIFGRFALDAQAWPMRVACIVTIVGTCAVMWNLWRRRPHDDPAALARDAHGYLRSQLVEQRDALASVARWYLGPFMPGMTLFVGAMVHESAQRMPLAAALVIGAIGAGVIAATFWMVLGLNRRAARSLDQQIAALDAGRDPNQPE
ncbi:hypothetical protein ABS767_08275 [Sphingomonas sp. ST-64]|uniref:Uncharacterized protein n=1 Tax=Sphingomonas plantiphila TaxID=3163295 RepID=A0ABW8YLK6_9SPHN